MKFQFTLLLSLFWFGLFAQNKVTYLKMQRTACFGRCKEYTVILNKNGTIEWEGKRNVDKIGKYTSKISQVTMKNFFTQLGKYKLSSVKSTYKPLATDLPHIHFTMILNGKTKGIKNADAGPGYLANIANRVDSLIADLDWKQVAKAENGDSGSSPVLDIQLQKDKSAYVMVDQEAEYPGGPMAMMEFIRKNIMYPELAKDAGVQGKVICNFTIGKDGEVSDVKIMKGIGYGCDEEAMRVVRMMPSWKPARMNGQPVETHMNLPVDFKLK